MAWSRDDFQSSLMRANDPTILRACNCIGPRNGDPVCPCQMPAYRQREAERAAWEREQRRIAVQLGLTAKPRVRVKAKSRPSTPEARNG